MISNIDVKEPLPDRTFGVMVHNIYQARLVEAWRPQEVVGLDLVDHRGVSLKHRRKGYNILLCHEISPKAITKPTILSPLVRQNISWLARMQFQAKIISKPATNDDNDQMERIAMLLWQTLQKEKFDVTSDRLRVDVHPRFQLEAVCAALQKQAHLSQPNPEKELSSDPFEGPLHMTASRAQCTVRLTVVLVTLHHPKCKTDSQQSSATTSIVNNTTCYWGMDRRPVDNDWVNLPLNHEAHAEINIVSMNVDGKDPTPTPIPTVPLSRAYFKLWQVWTDILEPRRDELKLHDGVAMDIGASPGGWTQVLLHKFKASRVVCLEPAVMAERVVQHPSVHHVACHLQDWPSKAAEQYATTKFSTLVCDASLYWSTLLDQLSMYLLPHMQWSLPAVLVLTCKLPFRTPGSIGRHVEAIHERVPKMLEEWKSFFASSSEKNDAQGQQMVEMDWQLLHLFANSESERTLVVFVKEARPLQPDQREKATNT